MNNSNHYFKLGMLGTLSIMLIFRRLQYRALCNHYQKLFAKYEKFRDANRKLAEQNNELSNALNRHIFLMRKLSQDPEKALHYTTVIQEPRGMVVIPTLLIHEQLWYKGSLGPEDIIEIQPKDFPPDMPTSAQMDAALKEIKK